ncbi:uncharacterized protein ALTATR162_LOCUS8584 [Alternaria atra]|uniref:Uncharacterized protein n=1 Tax=Alternaria atra TaxID=119953 RepID=A0A8J2N8D6_9PLEO|nr:uncharacterized protein ALTATR162_LOCUS8584 [Alternaria atra]CAG5178206.1 unnamed protein product [Alternaria atra]
MYPQLPAGPSGVPRPPVIYSHYSASTRTPHGLGAANNDVDNEAKGEAAFERISRGARGTHSGSARFRTAARAATKAANRPRTAEAQSKPGALTKPSVKIGNGKDKATAPHRSETHSSINGEEDDIAEAIARSLDDKIGDTDVMGLLPPISGEQDDSDIAEAKILSLLSHNGPAKHRAKGHSYKSIGSGSASSSTAPHAALHSLLDVMKNNAKAAEEANPEQLAKAGPELAGIMRQWHNTIARVIYTTEAAEHQRMEDAKAQLDYDRVVENKHKREMDTFSGQIGAQMLQMQHDHLQELKEQKQAYENLLAQQVAKPSVITAQVRHSDAKPTQPRTVKSPSPHSQDEFDRLTNEITALNSKNETKVSNMQASHADQVLILHQKAERLANANTSLRMQEKSEKEKMQKMETMKQMYEAQLQEMKEEMKNSAKQIAKLKQQVPPIPPFIFTAGGGRGLSQSPRSDLGPSSQESSDSWSRKRARRG